MENPSGVVVGVDRHGQLDDSVKRADIPLLAVVGSALGRVRLPLPFQGEVSSDDKDLQVVHGDARKFALGVDVALTLVRVWRFC